MPAKSKHMERRKQRIANAKKNARLAGKLRRRRRLQALFGLLAIAAVLTLAFLWQTGFFESEPETEEFPTGEFEEDPLLDPELDAELDPEADPDAEATEDPAGEADEDPAGEADETDSETE
ncbi:hypothetical protein [Glycomyces sp. NRRL B-16210]|uniref:hypothetical protein n=1 Tax=Glycomyces sp. NRRL B-16210 TaxID=1463821 RepID=UPI0004C28911|nr:hypothetical protein [Glycomyces sp. NRRL B-16210]